MRQAIGKFPGLMHSVKLLGEYNFLLLFCIKLLLLGDFDFYACVLQQIIWELQSVGSCYAASYWRNSICEGSALTQTTGCLKGKVTLCRVLLCIELLAHPLIPLHHIS